MRKKLLSSVAGATLVLLLASGCQAAPLDIAPDQAKAFQSRVLAITTAVADGGYAAALETLAALETELDAAAADGSVSFARHQRIERAMTEVRADVQAAIDAQTEQEPAPAPVVPATPAEEEDVSPDTETDAEKKAREAEEKAAEEVVKKAEDAKKKAAEDAKKKAAEDAKKKAAEDAKNKDRDTGDGEESGDGED